MFQKMKKIMLCIALCSFLFTCAGQEIINGGLKIAAQGSLIYPGCKFGFEYPVQRIELRKRNDKLLIKDRFLTANIGWYHHPNFHDNIYLITEWQSRKIRANGLFTEFSPGIGYSRTFIGSTTYVVNDAGAVNKVNSAGYNYALLSVGFGAGYNLAVRHDLPLALYSKISLLTLFPYNGFIYPRPTLEIGIVFKLQNFLNNSITSITKSKK